MKVKTTILVFLFFNVMAMAQHSIDICYNESIDLGAIEGKTEFFITGNGKSAKVKGDKINSYKFENPGVYHVKVVENQKHKHESCGHNSLPQEIVVNVSRIKMTYDPTGLLFSEPLHKNTETNGIVLSIPIRIQTFDHQPIQLNRTVVNTAGIGANITAHLNQEYNLLTDGEHIIKYNLTGSVNQNSIIMFDFIDANGKVQSVALQTPITN